MGDHEAAGEWPIVGADADHVARIQVAEDVLTYFLHGCRLHPHEQLAVAGQVGAQDGALELFSQLVEPFTRNHDVRPFTTTTFSSLAPSHWKWRLISPYKLCAM